MPSRLIVFACLGVFMAMVASGVSPMSPNGLDLIKWGANFAPLTLNGDYWRLFTSLFLHAGFLHLLFNMWVLWVFGPDAEKMFGRLGFILVYLLSGLGASAMSASWNPQVLSTGASGAIFGLVGSMIAFLRQNRAQKVAGPLVAFVFYNVIFGLIMPGIDNAAHLGGLGSGFIIGTVVGHRKIPAVAKVFRYMLAGFVIISLVLGVGYVGKKRTDPMSGVSVNIENKMQDGKNEEALRIAEESAKNFPGDPSPHLAMGEIYFRKGEFESALSAFKKAVEIAPENLDALHNLAITLVKLGKYSEGLTALDKLIGLKPKDTALYEIKGTVLMDMGRFGDAAQTFGAAIENGMSGPSIWSSLGTAHYHDLNIAKAKEALAQALDRAPLHPESLYTMGIIDFIEGNYEKSAEELLKTEAKKSPEYLNLWRYFALTQAGRKADAKAFLSRRSKDDASWEANLVKFAAGDVTLEKMQGLADASGKKTELYFYAALKNLVDGDKNGAAANLEKALLEPDKRYVEYAAAKLILERIN